MLSRATVAPAATSGPKAEIRFVDIGQGDGVVMRIGGKIIVSDTGEFHYAALEKALKDDLKATRIDVLILTHAHSDHARDAARLLKEWEVGRVVMNRSLWWDGPAANKAVTAAIRAEPNLKRTYPVAGRKYKWGDAEWLFAHPRSDEFLEASSGAAGNSSLVYLLRVNGVTALFTGDIETPVADRLAETLKPVLDGERVDIFLMTHHGADRSASVKLNKVIRPSWVVISAGQANKHRHPRELAVGGLKAVKGASIWCTPTNGTVTARISSAGTLTWKATGPLKVAWWSGRDRLQHGKCNEL
jgi:competence protein ComEC